MQHLEVSGVVRTL